MHFNAFYDVKNVNFQMKNSDIIFLFFARGINCGEFLRSVFWGGNKKIMYVLCKTPILLSNIWARRDKKYTGVLL